MEVLCRCARPAGPADRHLCKIRVEDVDAAFAPAVEPRWQLTQTLRDVAPEEWGGTSFPRVPERRAPATSAST